MSSKSKTKGKSWERDVCLFLSELYNQSFIRVPGSGAFIGGTNQFRKETLSDEQIKCLIERRAVIGGALDAWMMVPDWQRGKTTPEESGVKLEHMIDHMDHICQLAGNADHIGIGTDLDGGYGREQSPGDLDTIADLGKLPSMLAKRGYKETEITGVMHGNFIRFLNDAWA